MGKPPSLCELPPIKESMLDGDFAIHNGRLAWGIHERRNGQPFRSSVLTKETLLRLPLSYPKPFFCIAGR
jgi:hypothetical protein